MRQRKTDKIDDETLAQTQFALNRKPSYVQEESFEQLRDLSHFYQNLTEDIVRAKNRLYKVLQTTFPEIEKPLASPTGAQYWKLVLAFPIAALVFKSSRPELVRIVRQSTAKRISEKRVVTVTDKVLALAEQSYPAVAMDSPMLETVRYYAQELSCFNIQRQSVLDQMIIRTQTLPEYDIGCSIPGIAETTAASIIGELGDLRYYQSGDYLAKEHITKRGNPYARKVLFKAIYNIVSVSRFKPNHIVDFYAKRKRQSPKASTKPYAIASMHRLIRCLYYLITQNKL